MSIDFTKGQAERLALIAKNSRHSDDEVLEAWHERAAIREYEGGMKRTQAERAALDDTADMMFGRQA